MMLRNHYYMQCKRRVVQILVQSRALNSDVQNDIDDARLRNLIYGVLQLQILIEVMAFFSADNTMLSIR